MHDSDDSSSVCSSDSEGSEGSSIVVELDLQKDGHIAGTSASGIDLSFQTYSGFFDDKSCNHGLFSAKTLESLRRDAEFLFFRFELRRPRFESRMVATAYSSLLN
jgi:hypothetical protein